MEPSRKRQDMIKAAKLYYYGDMSQDEVAQLMGISRPKVSRLLNEARQLNIVQIIIRDSSSSILQNAEKLKKRFALEYVHIVPTQPSEAATKASIGQAASAFLNKHLSESCKIGISWGTTLASFVHEFQSKRPMPKATVVQMVGGTYSQSLNIDARELVKDLAGKLACRHSILQAPFFVHNPKLREMLMDEPDTKTHFQHLHNLDIAFVGVGNSYYKDSVVFRANFVDESAGKLLSEMGIVCDICGHQIMLDGSAPRTYFSDRVTGISLEDLRRVPLVVGLCEGKSKVTPLLAALHGGYINCLITDEVAALTLISEEHL